MFTRYHEPYGDENKKEDPLPNNWGEISEDPSFLPDNFGKVSQGKLYRSAILWSSQIPNLQSKYGIKHIISLIYGDWLEQYYESEDIHIHQFPFYQRRELTPERASNIALKISKLEGAVLVHCLKGAVRTSMVCSAYEIQQMNKNKILSVANNIRFGNFNISANKEIIKYY